MSLKLTILLIFLAILLVLLSTHFLKKGRIPVKYTLLWYSFSLFILILSFFPGLITYFTNLLGFQLASNMIIFILIGINFLLIMSLTIILAGQNKKTTLLIQKISILNSEVHKYDSQQRK